MIIPIIVILNALAFFTAFLAYAAGLTRKPQHVDRLASSEATLKASLILRDLDEPYHARLKAGGIDASPNYNRKLMPVLLDESRGMAKASRDLLTLLLFGLYLAIYACVWAKTRLKANNQDLRALIGAEMLLQRASS